MCLLCLRDSERQTVVFERKGWRDRENLAWSLEASLFQRKEMWAEKEKQRGGGVGGESKKKRKNWSFFNLALKFLKAGCQNIHLDILKANIVKRNKCASLEKCI